MIAREKAGRKHWLARLGAAAGGLVVSLAPADAHAQDAASDAARTLATEARTLADAGHLTECGARYHEAFAQSPQEIYLWNAASCLQKAAATVPAEVGPTTPDPEARSHARSVLVAAHATLKEYLGTFPDGRKKAEAEGALKAIDTRLVGTLNIFCEREGATLRIQNPAGGTATVSCPARVDRATPGEYTIEAGAPGQPHPRATGLVTPLEETRVDIRWPAAAAPLVLPAPAPIPAPAAAPTGDAGLRTPVPPPAPGSEETLHVRLLAGMAANNLVGHGEQTVSTTTRLGPTAAVGFAYAPISVIELAAELAYRQVGAEATIHGVDPHTAEIHGHAVSLPLLARLLLGGTTVRFQAAAGLAPALRFGVSEDRGSATQTLSKDWRTFDVGLEAGLGGGLCLADHWFTLEGRYGRGLVPVNTQGAAAVYARDLLVLVGVDAL